MHTHIDNLPAYCIPLFIHGPNISQFNIMAKVYKYLSIKLTRLLWKFLRDIEVVGKFTIYSQLSPKFVKILSHQ